MSEETKGIDGILNVLADHYMESVRKQIYDTPVMFSSLEDGPIYGPHVWQQKYPPVQGPPNPRIQLGHGFTFGLDQWTGNWEADCPGYESESVDLYREDVDELVAFLQTWRDVIPPAPHSRR